jgi:hypothetical protein
MRHSRASVSGVNSWSRAQKPQITKRDGSFHSEIERRLRPGYAIMKSKFNKLGMINYARKDKTIGINNRFDKPFNYFRTF